MTASIRPDVHGRWKMIVSSRRFTGPLAQALIKQLCTSLTRGGHTITDSQVIKISSRTDQPLAHERRPMFAHVQSPVNWCSLKNVQLTHCNWAPFKLAVHCALLFGRSHFSTHLAMLLSWTRSAQGIEPFWLRVICETDLTCSVFTTRSKLSRTCRWQDSKDINASYAYGF